MLTDTEWLDVLAVLDDLGAPRYIRFHAECARTCSRLGDRRRAARNTKHFAATLRGWIRGRAMQ